MIKNCLFAVALASLALAGGCAKGGNGIVPPPPSVEVKITSPADVSSGAIYPGQILTLTATVSNSTNTAVTWSLSPSGAGTLTPVTPPTTPATATYVAPATVPAAGSQPTITATLVSDTSVTGPLGLTVVDVTTDVAPATLSVGKGLTQTFTAVAVPDAAETQTFTWNCTAGGSANHCVNFHQDANVSGLAYYAAQDSCSGSCVQISALSTLDQNGCSNAKNCTIAKFSLVPSRVSGPYAFQFSGYDNSNHATAVAGTFTASSGPNGTATIAGVEDELTSSGAVQRAITGVYTPISSSDPNSNNAGTIALTLPSGVYPNRYQVVLDGGGDISMIESDGQGAGSGIAQKSLSSFTGTTAQTYAFGFTGVDSGGNRVGYAGVVGFSGTPNVANDLSGSIDVNDGGQSSNSVCSSTPPCTIAGKYTPNGNGSWSLTLTSPVNMSFDFFIASGSTPSKTNPLTFYAISTDPTFNPAVSGTMVLQDSSPTYNNAAFKGTSVSALTGVNATCAAPPCANVSLTLGTTDGNGNFSGQFDQNNAGTIVSVPSSLSSPSFAYTYAATGTSGRYTFQMLGNPDASPVVSPLTFVLYASGANRGFLLEQGGASPPDTSVMTGTMNPQGKIPCAAGICALSGSELPGTYAAATTSSGSFAVDPIAANLLFIWANPTPGAPCASECASGTQYDAADLAGVTLAGTYTLQNAGNGTAVLTPPAPASTQNYVIYALDTSGCTNQSPVCAVQDFLMFDATTTNPNKNPSIIFAQQ